MLVGPLGMWLSRPLLWKLLAGTAQCLKPLALLLRDEVLKSFVLQADETPVRYLGEEPGKSSLGYLFGYAGDAERRFKDCWWVGDRSSAAQLCGQRSPPPCCQYGRMAIPPELQGLISRAAKAVF